MATKHAQDDIRGNLVVNVGKVVEEKTYLKVRIGNNKEDVDNLRKQIQDECGQTPEYQSIWGYLGGTELKPLAPDCKFKAKDGGFWVDMNRAKKDIIDEIKPFAPSDDVKGELFVEMAITSDKTFKEGFYNSLNMRISLDGSHEFAQNFGLFLVKLRKFPIHDKLLLNIIKKFKEFDFHLEFETLENLTKETAGKALLDDEKMENAIVDDLVRSFAAVVTQLGDAPEMNGIFSKGLRLVVFLNKQLYANIELKGDDVVDYLTSRTY